MREIGMNIACLLYTSNFGKLFGGLIVQWGILGASGIVNLTWSIAMTAYTICGTDYNTSGNGCILSFYDLSKSGCKCRGCRVLNPNVTETFAKWIAVGR